MIGSLLLFGASGDLAGRYLLPALAALLDAGRLPHGFALLCASREDYDDESFRSHAAERLRRHASHVPTGAREALVASLRYRSVDLTDADSVARVVEAAAHDGTPSARTALPTASTAAYLALPPGLFAAAVRSLGQAKLPAGSRIVIEKPFGASLEDAIALNALLRRVCGAAGERAIFRVDHVLGMSQLQGLVESRSADPNGPAAGHGERIEQVEILWEETLGLEGRAGYYDTAGALKDVMQNHLLQILSLVAMEPPASAGERTLRDGKVAALGSVRSLGPTEVASRTRRARYTDGRLAMTGGAPGQAVPAYVDERGVDAARDTETFAEITLELDDPRWAGTRFLLRAGKAMAQRRRGVSFHFRTGKRRWVDFDSPADGTPEAGGTPGTRRESESSAYARVLLDILSDGSSLSVRGDEAEAAWRIVTPVLQGWADGRVPMEHYQAGSSGPPRTAARAGRMGGPP